MGECKLTHTPTYLATILLSSTFRGSHTEEKEHPTCRLEFVPWGIYESLCKRFSTREIVHLEFELNTFIEAS
jgi:hypothetical protein